jgi:hypothetical protein
MEISTAPFLCSVRIDQRPPRRLGLPLDFPDVVVLDEEEDFAVDSAGSERTVFGGAERVGALRCPQM